MLRQQRKSRPLDRLLPRRAGRRRPLLEELETRTLLAASVAVPLAHPAVAGAHIQPQLLSTNTTLSVPLPFFPGDIAAAYGFDKIQLFNPHTGKFVAGDGSGQTIAIVDAFDDANITSDLAIFDNFFGLPAANLIRVDQNGNPITAANTPPAAPHDFTWGIETSLDVEWAHALAPAATIVLFEANSNSGSDLFAADASAGLRGVYKNLGVPVAGVVSNSYGGSEFAGESAFDANFKTKDNHATYVFSSGDFGVSEYPSASPNVLSVGGTTLTVNFDTTTGKESYGGETAWSLTPDPTSPTGFDASGGGTSPFENEPFYQFGVQQSFHRTTPDVALDADPATGVFVVDDYDVAPPPGFFFAFQVGGTSFSAPAWSSLLAITNQSRALYGLPTLGNAQEATYFLPSSDFHDITSGSNLAGSAGPGYDQVTGRGSPIAPAVVRDLTFAFTIPVFTVGTTPGGGITIAPAARAQVAATVTPADAAAGMNSASISVALSLSPAARAVAAAPVTVAVPSAGQAVRADANSGQVTALPFRTAGTPEGFHGSAATDSADDDADAEPGEFGPSAEPTDARAPAAAPAVTARVEVRAQLPAAPAGTGAAVAAFSLDTLLPAPNGHAGPAPVAVVAGEETRQVDAATMAGLALVLGGTWSAVTRAEETRKYPALRR